MNPSYNNEPANFDQTLTIPLLDDPSQYFCSVIRFAIPLNAIPYFKFPVDTTQNNANIGTLIFGIQTAGGLKYPIPVIYVPNNNLSAPTASGSAPYFTNNQIISNYYSIYSINQTINMFNVALASAIAASGVAGTVAYSYSPTTQLISLIVSATFIATGASVFMNDSAENFISTFELYENFAPTVQDDYLHVLTPLPTNVGGFYTFTQETVGMSLWFDLRRIIVTSNSLPVKFESVPAQNLSGGNGNGLVSYAPILTDFIIGLDDFSTASCVATYNPTSQYRLIDMTSKTPINKVQISLLYSDKYGNVFPILLDKSQSASVKLAFVHKSLYLGNILLNK